MSNKTKDEAIAMPTKRFFVSMLTRDISLDDAILDLVDNCLDGALRMSKGNPVDYSNHEVELLLSEDLFSIKDNCGGIPREIAKNYAFKMGRDLDDTRDSSEETIGMYGVGMKRAIFKMGQDARVSSFSEKDNFVVPITTNWLEDKEWKNLAIDNIEPAKAIAAGTVIEVSKLFEGVSSSFRSKSFLNNLETAISEHFCVFLKKGLTIKLNGVSIPPVKLEVLTFDTENSLAPFIYEKEINGVTISMIVGVNRSIGTIDDSDDSSTFETDKSSPSSGWTILCNDRAIIVGDKTRLTGWGDGLPLYHYQFSILTGIIEFKAKDASTLPVTTTKRDLDTSSDVWLEAIVKMKEAMRVWVNYTNSWKNQKREDKIKHWENAQPVTLHQAIKIVASREKVTKRDGSKEFNPLKRKVIPKLKSSTPSSKRIVFTRPTKEIQFLGEDFFEDENAKPGMVGEECFRLVYELKQKKS